MCYYAQLNLGSFCHLWTSPDTSFIAARRESLVQRLQEKAKNRT